MSKLKVMILTLLFFFFAAAPVMAQDFDGSTALICAVIEIFDCGPGVDCQRGNAKSINIPQFLKINFKEKTISGKLGSGELRTTKIKNTGLDVDNLMLQGIQGGRAWSMIINQATGDMTLTASDFEAGFVVFGACIAY